MVGNNGSAFREWTENDRWFRANYQRLARRYDGLNVCIYKRRVVDHDGNFERLMKRIEKKLPMERVLVEYVSRRKLEFIL